jgi:hypothetical protein
MDKYRFSLEGIEYTNIRIGAKHLVVIVFSVDEFQLEEFELLPCFFEFLLSLIESLL